MKRVLAHAVSWVFNPGILMLAILMIGVGASHQLSDRAITGWLVVLSVLSCLAIIVLYATWSRGIVLDADLASPINLVNRAQVLLIFATFGVIMVLASLRTHRAEPLHALTIVTLSLTLLAAWISRYWKISLHMLGTGALVTVALLVYGVSWTWITLLVFLVAWARLVLGRHTPLQLAAGTLLGVFSIILVFQVFHLI